jgi:membrane protease YdiL (CAAX protease family)
VLTGAIVFGLMHLGIYFAGGDIQTTIVIMFFTFFLGILAGLARQEKNLFTAITVHIAFNIGGVAGGIILML